METAKISQLYDLGETIAAELFAGLTYPWEALPKISDFIKKLGPTLDPEVYEQRGENIWVAKSATVAPTAFLNGPLIIDEDAEIRHQGECHRRKRLRGGQFNRIEKRCDF